jgi:hypothetical protein
MRDSKENNAPDSSGSGRGGEMGVGRPVETGLEHGRGLEIREGGLTVKACAAFAGSQSFNGGRPDTGRQEGFSGLSNGTEGVKAGEGSTGVGLGAGERTLGGPEVNFELVVTELVEYPWVTPFPKRRVSR